MCGLMNEISSVLKYNYPPLSKISCWDLLCCCYNAAALFLTKYLSVSVKKQILISLDPLFSFMSVNIRGQEIFDATVTPKTSWVLCQIFGGTVKKKFQYCSTFNFRPAAWINSHYFSWMKPKRKMDSDKPHPRKHWIMGDREVYNWLCSTALWMNRLKSGTYL